LSEYDYRLSGLYFVTICAHERRCLFGEVVGETVQPSRLGQVVQSGWIRSGDIRREIAIDMFVVMPNHLQGIVAVDQAVHPIGPEPQTRVRSLGSF
jgi:REP element-mobilizing transposase RayT